MIPEEDGGDVTSDSGFILPQKYYKKLKTTVQVLLPALSTLYFTLGNLWDWSNIEKVMGTSAALATFGGVWVSIASKQYKASPDRLAGTIDITEKDGIKLYNLITNGDPESIDDKDEVTFKVAPIGVDPT